jgi:hypothetical protein
LHFFPVEIEFGSSPRDVLEVVGQDLGIGNGTEGNLCANLVMLRVIEETAPGAKVFGENDFAGIVRIYGEEKSIVACATDIVEIPTV